MLLTKTFVMGLLLGGLCYAEGSRWWKKEECELDGCHVEYHAFHEEDLKAAVDANPNLPSKLAHCIDMFETDLAGNMYEGGIITDCIFENIPAAKSRSNLWDRVDICVRGHGLLPKNTELHNIKLFC